MTHGMGDTFKKRHRHYLSFLLIALIGVLSGCSGGVGEYSIVVFTDVHFDPFYDPSLFSELNGSSEDEWDDIFRTSTVTGPPAWGSETNYPLLTQALVSACREATSTPFLLFAGDILTHSFSTKFYEAYGQEDDAAMRSFTYKTVSFFADEVREHCGDVPVMFTLGNNDSYEGNYKIEPGGSFLADTLDLFYTYFLLHGADYDAFAATYAAGGYYATDLLHSNLVFISLNSILFSPRAADGSEGAADTQLDWFEATLADARSEGKKAWILLHIPPGVDIYSSVNNYMDESGALSDADTMWKEVYQQRYTEILQSHADVVSMTFAGHTHMDEYRLSIDVDGSGAEPVIVTPSVSPVFNNNPAFKVLTVSSVQWSPSDYRSLNYPLDVADPAYQSYYTFSNAYGLNGVLETTLAELYPMLNEVEADRENYIGYYYSGHNEANPINGTNWRAYWCGIGRMTKEDFLECVNGSI